jgi:hypothetical protein
MSSYSLISFASLVVYLLSLMSCVAVSKMVAALLYMIKLTSYTVRLGLSS